MPPAPTTYAYPLDEHGLDWIRVRFVKHRGQILDFTVQYETTIQLKRIPVVRYDTHHDRAHVDRLLLDGSQQKALLPDELTFDEAMTIGIRDILQNWRSYRDHVLRGPS